jgi:hypothetical protein
MSSGREGARSEQRPPGPSINGDSHELRARNTEPNSTPRRQIYPETEYDWKEGWPAVAAGSAIFFVYLGLIYSYGIVQLHLADAGLASVSTLSFIGSLGAAYRVSRSIIC